MASTAIHIDKFSFNRSESNHEYSAPVDDDNDVDDNNVHDIKNDI